LLVYWFKDVLVAMSIVQYVKIFRIVRCVGVVIHSLILHALASVHPLLMFWLHRMDKYASDVFHPASHAKHPLLVSPASPPTYSIAPHVNRLVELAISYAHLSSHMKMKYRIKIFRLSNNASLAMSNALLAETIPANVLPVQLASYWLMADVIEHVPMVPIIHQLCACPVVAIV